MLIRKWHWNRFLYLALVAVAVILVLHPLRLVLVNFVLPSAWVDTDRGHLYHVIRDVQDFKVDAYPIERDAVWGKVQVNMSMFNRLLQQRQNYYPEFYNYINTMKSLSKTDAAIRKRIDMVSIFQPVMTPLESAQLLFALHTLMNACKEARLIFFILEASLMGSIRHHGFIPWDDDIDIVMNARQWRKIRNVLGNIEGFELYAPSSSQWKFYLKTAMAFPNKPYKFPYVDIFFYEEDETHIWAITGGLKHDLVYSKLDIFPLNLRPFEHLMVPVPCNLELVVHKTHDQNACVTPEYIHKTSQRVFFVDINSFHCSHLYSIYPFVFTEKSEQAGFQEENLKVGTKVIHKRRLPVGCRSKSFLSTLEGDMVMVDVPN